MRLRTLSTLIALFLCVYLLSGCTASRTSNRDIIAPSASPYPTTETRIVPMLPLTPERVERMAVPKGFFVEIEKGDTLYNISKKYGISIDRIVAANNIENKNKIKEGKRLLIPGRASSGSSQTYREIPLYRDTGHWKYIVVHHTATLKGNKKFIDRGHVHRGFGEMGYHFIIDNGTSGKADGEIEVGGRWFSQKDGAHTRASNMNAMSVGVALVGNYSVQREISENQMKSLVYLVNILRRHHNIPISHILGHRDVPEAATECPGNYFPWKKFISMLEPE